MESFRGRFTNKIDAKGRVSVPAKFRAVTMAQGLNGVICFPPLNPGAFIEGCGPAFSDIVDQMLDRLDPFSPERQSLAAVLIGESAELTFDADGRVILPETLRNLAGIKDEATFVGMGQRFQVWEPKAYEEYYAKALEEAQRYRELLRAPGAPNSGASGSGMGGSR